MWQTRLSWELSKYVATQRPARRRFADSPLLLQIVSESGIAAGFRRIEAVSGPGLYDLLTGRERIVQALSSSLKVQPEQLEARIAGVYEEQRRLVAEVESLKVRLDFPLPRLALNRVLQADMAITRSDALLSKAVRLPSGIQLLVQQMDGVDAAALSIAAQHLQNSLGEQSAIVLGSIAATDKVCLVAAFSPSVVKLGASAGGLLGPLAKLLGGGGGGKPGFAQAGGRDTGRIAEALALAQQQLLAKLAE